ncbi:MAG TPA: sigma-54 dependent transcriptional regulator [Myxococcota bacterium]|nr:sigma-54 dependent transcriptional regulator [Myxococcota bacterium]
MTELAHSEPAAFSLLIVEDEPNLRAALIAMVALEGFATLEASTMEEARKVLAESRVDAVLVDLTLPDGSGLDLIGEPHSQPEPEYVVVTGDATAETAVQALRRGALDYLTKPVDRSRLRSVLTNLQRTRALKTDVSDLRDHLRELGRFGKMVGRSEPMQKVYALIQRVAPTDAAVFVTGESGTGKELVAETIHSLSARRARPFLALNCGAMAPTLIESELFGHEKGSFTGAERRRLGYFERANGSTLFLDEITEMPLDLQVKLLRVLEANVVTRVGGTEPIPVDVRIIAASNRDPLKAVANGTLREDLLYRLNVFPIELPPLRSRGADVTLLAERFLDEVNARQSTQKSFTPRALARLQATSWPGNVRELKNVVERAAILADDAIDVDALPSLKAAEPVTSDATLRIRVGSPLAEVERRLILSTLEALNGNKRQAAEALGISLKTLYSRLNVYQGHGHNEKPRDSASRVPIVKEDDASS